MLPTDSSLITSLVGHQIRFSTGPLAGRTIRVELVEIQRTDRGRKCGNSDVRPIDPPPIVHLRILEVHNPGTPGQREEEFEQLTETECYGWICHVDLFPMPPLPNVTVSCPTQTQRCPEDGPSTSQSQNPDDIPLIPWSTPALPHSSGSPDGFISSESLPDGSTIFPRIIEPDPGPRIASHRQSSHVEDSTSDTIATYIRGCPILESSKRTLDLVGNTFTPSSFHQVRLLFVFSNLAVREEGEFFLRYRAFNTLYPVMDAAHLPVLAECIGRPFRIYPTNGFPGLGASTTLTKEVMHSGVRVIARTSERKRRRSKRDADPPTNESEAPDASSSGDRQRNAGHIAPVPTPGVSMAAQVAAAGLRIVQEDPAMRGRATAGQHGARVHGKKRGGRQP